MPNERTKATLLQSILAIHLFGGTVFVVFINFFGENASKLQNNFIILTLVAIGLWSFFRTLTLLFKCYDEKSGKIDYKRLEKTFNDSLKSMMIFVIIVIIAPSIVYSPVSSIVQKRGECLVPYTIDGTVVFGNRPADNAIVYIENIGTGELHNTTTDVSGQYVINLANFKGCYGNGDGIELKACKDAICSSKQTIVVDTAKVGMEVNIRIA